MKTERDLILTLRAEFTKRCRVNSRYSLRAYAKSLGIDQSLLTKVLRGQRKLSKTTMSEVGKRLGLSPNQIASMISPTGQDTSVTTNYSQMAEDAFNVISDWYHFALLELFKVDGPKATKIKLARRLGIHPTEVEDALKRLERLGYIKSTSKGWIIQSPDNTWTNTETTSAARRNLQRALAQKNLEAIDNLDFSMRENGSLTLACDEKLLPEIRKKCRQFRMELDAYVQAKGNYNHVFQLVMAFFPLTKKPEDSL